MNEDYAVIVEKVAKKFKLYNSKKDRFFEALHPYSKKYHKEFWALKNINFKVKKGSTISIIGRNGSGKSTLLQIICKVLNPSEGVVKVDGRIASLLELGAGFNPEFTGRENVVLNGRIQGFTEKEMKIKMPVIEAFADIGEFIDQPVKTYSSGMFVRLAFASAVNIDPDILIVDEALAVGDAKFQHKCFSKFVEFREAGKTIIFVSHDTGIVLRHSDHAILLERGEIIEQGCTKSITNYYLDLLFTGKITGYEFNPVLISEGYKGFNIIHYKTNFIALKQSLGNVDIISLGQDTLEQYIQEKNAVIGNSAEEVKQLVNNMFLYTNFEKSGRSAGDMENRDEKTSVSGSSASSAGLPDVPNSDFIEENNKKKEIGEKAELDIFLEDLTEQDNCLNRKNYNKNEYRFGGRKAEIVDYFIASNNDTKELVSIVSGEAIDIYMKVKFNEKLDYPLFGFAVKTVEGVNIYASNTRFGETKISSAEKSDIIIFKFSMRQNLHPGDYFIDLGFAEKLVDRDEPVDIRYSIAHFNVKPKSYWFDGFVDFKVSFEEISRKREVIQLIE